MEESNIDLSNKPKDIKLIGIVTKVFEEKTIEKKDGTSFKTTPFIFQVGGEGGCELYLQHHNDRIRRASRPGFAAEVTIISKLSETFNNLRVYDIKPLTIHQLNNM
jgi:hypothetical protein